MSARKAVNGASFQHVTLLAREARLTLSPDAVVFHKGGIEFRSANPFASWTEVTITMQSPHGHGRLHCNGVVISCTGNKHAGYHVSMIFTSLSKHGQELLSQMAAATL